MNNTVIKIVCLNEGKDWEISNTRCIFISSGTFIKNKNNIYILTCLHSVDYCKKIKIFVKNDNINSELKFKTFHKFEDVDLALIEIEKTQINIEKEFNIVDFEICNSLPNLGENFYMLNGIYLLREKYIRMQKYNCSITKLMIENNIAKYYPKIPFLNVEIDHNECKSFDHEGLSGTGIYESKSNDFVGIIINKNLLNNELYLLPYYVIKRSLTEFFETKQYDGLCGLVADLSIGEYGEKKKSEKESVVCVEKCNNINYNYTNNLNNKILCFNLQNDDLIKSINDIEIDKDGNVFYEEIGINVPINTYIALNFRKNQTIKLGIYRKRKERNNDNYYYKFKYININCRSFKSLVTIPLKSYKFINIFGLTFIEFSEESINYFLENDVDVIDFLENDAKKKFSNFNHRYIVLSKICYDDNTKLGNNLYDKCNLPFPEVEKKKKLLILSKINNKSVKSTDNIKSLLKKDKENKIHLVNHKIKILLTVYNNLPVKINFEEV